MMLEARGSVNNDGLTATVDTARMLKGMHSRTEGALVVAWYDRPMEDSRFLGKCKGCKKPVSMRLPCVVFERRERVYDRVVTRKSLSVYVYTDAAGAEDWTRSVTCECGKSVTLKRVAGKVAPDHRCDARCTSAKGHNCECSCGGLNHGADWG
jgi:hypothetical protein